jgi:D-amino-acid dehydrogenase
MQRARSSLVIGGGFVGLSCALHLQRVGHRVTLLDKHTIGGPNSTSSGNSGTMAVYANVPINSPNLLLKLPGLLLDSTSPVSLLPRHIPNMLPWAALFAWNCRKSAVEHSASALAQLNSLAESGYEAVWEQARIDVDSAMGGHASNGHCHLPFAVRNGYLILQRDHATMRASEAGAALRRKYIRPDGRDLRMQALTQDEVLGLEPNLSPDVCKGG